MIRIAVDAMGGDHAPSAVVEGAVAAARHLDVQVALVGSTASIKDALAHSAYGGAPLLGVAGLVISASGAVAHDVWSNIVRRGRDSDVWPARSETVPQNRSSSSNVFQAPTLTLSRFASTGAPRMAKRCAADRCSSRSRSKLSRSTHPRRPNNPISSARQTNKGAGC